MVIKIADAIYGLNCQITPRVCGPYSGLAYGTSKSPVDVTESVQDACNGESSCTYTIVNSDLGGDPCWCVYKDFVYAYQCVPSDMVDTEDEVIVNYDLMVAKGIQDQGEMNMLMTVFNQESMVIKSMVILVGLFSIYGLYKLFIAAKQYKQDPKGEYQSLL